MTRNEEIAATVSDAEMEILKQLWLESPLSAQEIIERIEALNGGHPSTIKTLINRLLNKGALRFTEKNRKYYYFPQIRKTEFYKVKTRTFLDKFFDGEISPLVTFFSSHKKLSSKDLAELKSLIEKLEADDDN